MNFDDVLENETPMFDV